MKIARIDLDNGISFSVDEGQFPVTIGRAKSCDIRIREPQVSRLHCELHLRTGRTIWLKDLSSNGTTVNNKRIAGDSVAIDRRSSVFFSGDRSLTLTPTDDRGETLVPI